MSADMMLYHYRMLGLNLLVSLVVMYFVMFTMIDSLRRVLQQFEHVLHGSHDGRADGYLDAADDGQMCADKRLNTIIYAGCALLFILAFAACGPRGWSETDSSSAR